MNRFLSFIVGLMGLLLIAPDLSAQNGFEVRGTVTDQTGQPVIGATVLEKGIPTDCRLTLTAITH